MHFIVYYIHLASGTRGYVTNDTGNGVSITIDRLEAHCYLRYSQTRFARQMLEGEPGYSEPRVALVTAGQVFDLVPVDLGA